MAEGPLSRAVELGAAFESYGVPYAIGGALAYGVWAIPRATVDVDINVFVDETSLEPVVAALTGLGVELTLEQAVRDATHEGQFIVRYGGYRVDIFTASIPFCAEAARTRVRVPIAHQETWFLSAESVAVFKMLFFRPKDIVDLERLLVVRQSELDTEYVRDQLVNIVGADDARISRWDRLTNQGRDDQEYVVERDVLLRSSKLFTVLRSDDGALIEVELDRSMLGKLRDGDRVRITDSGLEVVRNDRDRSRQP